MGEGQGRRYWLDDPRNVRKVLYALYAVCALLFAADFFYHKHVVLDFEGWFGFYGVYGFVACVALVLAAKELRKIVSRPPDYYGADEEGKPDDGARDDR